MTVAAANWLGDVRANLNSRKGHWREIARASGVPYHTVVKVASGKVSDPHVSTIQALHNHFAHGSDEHSMSGNTAAN